MEPHPKAIANINDGVYYSDSSQSNVEQAIADNSQLLTEDDSCRRDLIELLDILNTPIKPATPQTMASSSDQITLPANIPPLQTFPDGGGSITSASIATISQAAAQDIPDFRIMLENWKSTVADARFTATGTRTGVEGGSFDAMSGVINVNPSRVTSPYFNLTIASVVAVVGHEIRHAFQLSQVKQNGKVNLGVARDPVTGVITWQTFTKAQIEDQVKRAAKASARKNYRTYAMTPIEIDARMFAEYMSRSVK